MPLVEQGSFQRLYNEKANICIEYQSMLRKFFPNGNYEAAFDPFSDFFYEIDSIFQRSESCKNEIRVILNCTEIKTLESKEKLNQSFNELQIVSNNCINHFQSIYDSIKYDGFTYLENETFNNYSIVSHIRR